VTVYNLLTAYLQVPAVFIPTASTLLVSFLRPDLPATMYPVGVATLLQFLWEHELPSMLVLVTLSLLLLVVSHFRCNNRQQDTPPNLPRFPLFNALSFFQRRHDFLAWGFRVTDQRLFQFRLLHVRQTLVDPPRPKAIEFALTPARLLPWKQNNVVVVSGERGRRDFFNAKGLDLQEGFRILTGAVSNTRQLTKGASPIRETFPALAPSHPWRDSRTSSTAGC
jgi:hypothetical protein